jgi:hypothetical protein
MNDAHKLVMGIALCIYSAIDEVPATRKSFCMWSAGALLYGLPDFDSNQAPTESTEI